METIGIFAGKFLPPHLGHISFIKKSKKMCDKLFVVLSENLNQVRKLCKDNGLPYIDAKLRIKWLKEHFKYDSNIIIKYIDESKISGDFHIEWAKELYKIAGGKIDIKFAGEEYRGYNEKYYPECKFVGYDKNDIPISATMIRENPKKYFDMIIPEAQNYFRNLINQEK